MSIVNIHYKNIIHTSSLNKKYNTATVESAVVKRLTNIYQFKHTFQLCNFIICYYLKLINYSTVIKIKL